MFVATRTLRVRTPVVGKALLASRPRFYSEHAEEHHDEHHEEHHDHGPPESPAENMFNSTTLTFAGFVAAAVGYQYLNSSYQKSHDGKSIVSLITHEDSLEELKANYDEYRQGVSDRETLRKTFIDAPIKTSDNLVTAIRDVPGRKQCFGGSAQFNTISDWSKVGPRKKLEDPFH